MKIYHNNRCGKSRSALDIIRDHQIEPEIVEYLKDTPSKEAIKTLVSMLGMNPADIIRKNETIYKEKYKGKVLTDDQWIDVMVENPILIERPIIIKDGKAIIARPPEKVLEFL